MLSVGRILTDYRDAGAVNGLLPFWGFVDDTTFLTKAGHLGVAYRMQGVDFERLTHTQRATLSHRFAAALRLLDERYRVYQYLIKRTAAPVRAARCVNPVAQDAIQQRAAFLNARRSNLYELNVHVVLIDESLAAVRPHTLWRDAGRSVRQILRTWLSDQQMASVLDARIRDAAARLSKAGGAFAIHLDELGPSALNTTEMFRLFRQLVNYDRRVVDAAQLTYDAHLDFFVADSALECHRDHLMVGDRAVTVLSMKEPPSRTFAQMLTDLCAIPGEFVACLEWQRLSNHRLRRTVQMRRRHFFNKRVSLVNYVAADTRPEEMLIDDSAQALVRQLGDALTELEVNGHFFGLSSLTLALHSSDRASLVDQSAEAMKVMAAHDGCFIEERYNLLNAWLSTVPGNGRYNVRRLALLDTNCADLSFLFTLDSGTRESSQQGGGALGVFETPRQVPYGFNLHVDDVGHTLVLGATGSGKSFLLNFLLTHAQQYDPLTVVLDLGHSYRKLATLLRGGYLELGLRHGDVTINPFALDPTAEHLHFLHAFVRVLLEGADSYRLSHAEDREVYEAVESLYVLDRIHRRLLTLANLLPRALGERLRSWVVGGRYASFFDNLDDTLSIERFQVFDFERMRAYPALLEPLLFYILHRITARVTDPADQATLKVCILDEAWRFIQHPTLRTYVQEALKTWRKRNGAMLLATQAIDDFSSTDLLRTVIESCPTKLLLANPAFDATQYADLFQLNERELQLFATLVPRQQLLLKRPGVTKVLTLNVDPKSYWLYTNTPLDNERLADIVRQYGFESGLDRLATPA